MILPVTLNEYFDVNSFFYIDDKTGHGFLIDPGAEPEKLLKLIRENGWVIEKVLLTHGHFDHIAYADDVRRALDIPILAFRGADRYLLDPEMNLSTKWGPPVTLKGAEFFDDGAELTLGADPDFSLKVIHTPGHTPDSVIFYTEKDRAAFAGDTIFKASIGNYTFPGGDYDTLIKSIRERIFTLPEETVLYSGHTEETTVGAEKRRYGL